MPSPSFGQASASRIDRRALVTRHNPTLTRIDPASPLMVGNGNLGFTADITGLQTFQEQVLAARAADDPGAVGVAQLSQPDRVLARASRAAGRRARDVAAVPVPAQLGRGAPAAHPVAAREPASHLVGSNRPAPGEGGRSAAPRSPICPETRQTLDLWTGRLESRFVFDGAPVEVETSVHPTIDAVIVRLRSPLLASGRLGVDLSFPGVGRQLNPNPADWAHPEAHQTSVQRRDARTLSLESAHRRHPLRRHRGRGSARRAAADGAARLPRDRARGRVADADRRVLARRRSRSRYPPPKPPAPPSPRRGPRTGAAAVSSTSRAAPIRGRRSSNGASCCRSTSPR